MLTALSNSGKRPYLILILLAALVFAEAFLHRSVNYEIEACSAWRLANVFGGDGCTSLINGEPYHVEGTVNLKNTFFFAGGDDNFSLSYEIATNRLLVPYLASFLVPLSGNLTDAIAALNLLAWILGSWAMYGLGREVFNSEQLGIVLGVLTASSIGFIGNWMGVKGYCLSYAYFICAIYYFEKSRLFREKTTFQDVVAAGLIISMGTFANNLHLPLLLYCLVRGGVHLGWRRFLGLCIIAVLPFLLLKGVFEASGVFSKDRGSMVLGHFLGHIKLIFSALLSDTPSPLLLEHGPVKVVTDPWQPFAWLPQFLLGLVWLGGVPLGVLWLAGLGFLRRKTAAVALAMIFSSALAVFFAQTYWPYWEFNGYTIYYAVFGFFVIAALGIGKIAERITLSAERVFGKGLPAMNSAVVAALLAGLVLYANEDVLTGRQIQFYQFHIKPQMDYPYDWDFHRTDW